ncbi:MAG TPA: C40 family peptidase [Nitrospirota bacterium]
MKNNLIITLALLVVSVLSFPACASAPVAPVLGHPPDIGETAADTAVSMIGRPYKYRGETPEGFDCSGLVRYSYLAAGLDVPHGTGQLMRVTRPVEPGTIRKGDLLFFNEKGRKYSHVGIWLGDDVFVHAPSTGGTVRTDSLEDPYWKKNLFGARRFL